MYEIGAFEAKTHFSALLEKVAKGEQVLITKRGDPVAILNGIKSAKNNKKEAIRALIDFAEHHQLSGLNWKDLRDEGKR